MKIITAVCAKNLATNFENNGLGEIINDIMDEILAVAIMGERQVNVRIPMKNFSFSSLATTRTFFLGLGYTVSNMSTTSNCLYYTISW